MNFAIVEKKNHHAIHGLFDSIEIAELHLSKTIPEYVSKSYFTDKTLTKNDFEIIIYQSSNVRTKRKESK